MFENKKSNIKFFLIFFNGKIDRLIIDNRFIIINQQLLFINLKKISRYKIMGIRVK